MSQGARGISHSINEEALSYAIQPMVNNNLKTWHRRNTVHGSNPTPADQDFALRNLQAKIYRAIHDEGSKWAPPDSAAGHSAAVSDAAEK
eukprot:5223603-Pyramimonas_sp.AAC.1